MRCAHASLFSIVLSALTPWAMAEQPPTAGLDCEPGDVDFETVQIDGEEVVFLRRGPGCPGVEPEFPATARAVAQETTVPATTAAPERYDTSTDEVVAVSHEGDTTGGSWGAGDGDDTTTGSGEGTTVGGVEDTSTGAPEEAAGAEEAAHREQPAAVPAASGDAEESVAIVASGLHEVPPAARPMASGGAEEPVAVVAGRAGARAARGPRRSKTRGGLPIRLQASCAALALVLALFILWPVISSSLCSQEAVVTETAADAKRRRTRTRTETAFALAALKEAQEQQAALESAEEGARRAALEEAARCARAAAERRCREEAVRLARLEAERMAREAAKKLPAREAGRTEPEAGRREGAARRS
ncbi:unnamed protein product [Prorocentrum cordatum]|uniref:Uncharacterized protein n=1 Tax=Prorocentrum cordatum TaxID=2364126 RepID=A0ABN9XXS9_9DINO|nr:unnamed protein product [Polarella glacialis]